MTLSLTSSANLIKPNVDGAVEDINFRPCDLLDWFERTGRSRANDGGQPYKWNIRTGTTQTAETFVEGQGLPGSGAPVYQQASLSAVYQRVIIDVTGHLRDQVARGGVYDDPIANGYDDAIITLRALAESTLTGSTANRGIASIIDANDVYAGLDPASVTEWAALETNVGGAQSVSVLNTMYRTLSDAPRGAESDTIMSGLLQRQRYTDLLGAASSVARSMPIAEAGRPYDLGNARVQVSFNGAVWVPVRGITSSELYMLDAMSGIELRWQRPLQNRKLAPVNDSDQEQISWGFVPVVRKRRRHGKATGLS